ncbi:uncharacterized protein [Solanum lycopersicum]|uniref:uncharacterized protein n=1 Tax=Solanum lycopersicum TaxID=4081 RepID=UPI00374990C6
MRDRILTKVQATIGFISGLTAPKVVNHKRIHTPRDVIEDIRELYGVEISYQQAWRARERALEMLKGKPSKGYKQMSRYIWMLNNVYPNSYIRMQKTEDNKFMYLFIALRSLIRGFDYCRPVVVVDAAHLGGAYKGTFVSASTLDGAGCILPLAYGVVDTENDCSWTWFFEHFKNAFAYRKEDFDKLMAKVVKVDHRVKDYLEEAGYEKWSRVHSTINRGRMMTLNIAECINGCLVDARKLTIIDFLEEARLLFGSWNYKNREIASYTKDTLGGRFEEILIVNASKSSKMKVVPSSEYIFTFHEAGKRYIVCLERKTCTCGRFQHDEIPCAHTIAALKHKNVNNLHPYCSDYSKPYALEKTYEVVMVPMPDKEDWNVPEYVLDEIVRPPRYRRLAGNQESEERKMRIRK